ncbi:tagatose 1,6-diphosphate aldolase [Calidithermus roseus]|uniref:tagatose-bisphosphate aldolase n=1 Tax=Calidithermus roseus TaxID=1644118 RepID=A0A399EQS4_9DEIN|nr:tagatose 1,6-diphosphate aldolase [Calidithermus roseus]RIH85886.1 Tagatose 1,6-diphosphate aldolase [Calidithermus roseus]
MRMGKGKYEGIQACADEKGIIAAAAMDQRGSLRKAIAKAKGGDVSDGELTEFKMAVTKILTPYASAILLDPEFGLPALKLRAPGTGVLLAYEKSGYDTSGKGRLPDLLPEWSVRRLVEVGANAIKILLYYNPFDEGKINAVKHAFIERVGAECAALDVPFFLEPLAYDDSVGDEKSLEFARVKPKYVAKYMEEFSKDRYGVDVLKVELPINLAYTQGTSAFKGEAAYTRAEAIQHLKATAQAAGKPFIYLSAGVSDAVFRESLELAIEADVPFSGVLCGRATWQEGIPVYATQGVQALEEWLSERGVRNIQLLNEVLAKGAKPWWTHYGSLEAVRG